MSISHIRIKIKDFVRLVDRRDVWAVLTICLSGISGYFIGHLDSVVPTNQPVLIEMRDLTAIQVPAKVEPGLQANEPAKSAEKGAGKYVASKSGTKYHLTTCSGARTISEANKIWFETKEDAEKAGYAPAANCKGI